MDEVQSILEKNEVVIFYISRPDWSVCHALAPKVEQILKNYPEIRPVHINACELPTIAERFMVFSAPAILLFLERKEVMRKAGIISMNELEHEVFKIYNAYYN